MTTPVRDCIVVRCAGPRLWINESGYRTRAAAERFMAAWNEACPDDECKILDGFPAPPKAREFAC